MVVRAKNKNLFSRKTFLFLSLDDVVSGNFSSSRSSIVVNLKLLQMKKEMAAEAGSWLLTAIDNASGRESHLQAHTHTHEQKNRKIFLG